MKLLKFAQRYPGPQILTTDRLLLRNPINEDFKSWANLRQESAGFLVPFEPQWERNELSRASYRTRLRRNEADIRSGKSLPWFLFDRHAPDCLLGGLTISNIRRGVAQTGTIGYWMGEAFSGQGYMREALMAACEDAFSTHGLHRLEAATVLHNKRSQRLLRSCGFQKEGQARAYLKINGEWQDHVLFARLAGDQT